VLHSIGFLSRRDRPVLPLADIRHLKPAFFRPTYQTLVPLPSYLVSEHFAARRKPPYPAGDDRAAIFRSMPTNSRQVSDGGPRFVVENLDRRAALRH
jgi:hypothetical protein